MSNENQNQPITNPYDPTTIGDQLRKTVVQMNVHGCCFKETCSGLERKLEGFFGDQLKIQETEHVFIYPVVDERGGALCEIKCFIYFDVTAGDPKARSIWKSGSDAADGGFARQTILPYIQGKSPIGEYDFSERFTTVFTPIAMLDNDGRISVSSYPRDKRIAIVELDFMLVMALAMNIEEDAPFNFTVLAVDSTNNMRNGGNYEDAIILMMKYVDNSRRSGRGRNHNRKINYNQINRELIGRTSGRGRGRDY